MKNFEKYKKEVYEAIVLTNSDKLLVRAGIKFNPFVDNYREYKDRLLVWLFEEYKEHILDEVEREYLKAVIRPFRKEVATISKFNAFDGRQYIYIEMKDRCWSNLPYFPKGTMYKGMKEGTHYTLKELGL